MKNSPIAATSRAIAHFERGNLLREQQKPAEAMAAFRAAIDASPGFGEAHLNLGYLLERAGQLTEAALACERAAALQPERPEAHLNLGNVLLKLGELDAAIAAYRAALVLRPDYAEVHLNLGHVFRLLNQLDAAADACQRALSARPDYADAWVNLANIYRAQNRLTDALMASERALALAPHSPQAHLNFAMALLVGGDLRAGWPHAEYRHALKLAGAGRSFTQPQWDGRESLAGKTILLHGEQGFGDTLQFVRFVEPVVARGARVCLEIQPPLKRLLAASFPQLTVLAHGELLPDFDLHCSLASLPLALDTEIATIPARVPYVSVPVACATRFRNFFGRARALRIGLAWAGNPTHPNDRNRSMTLASWAKIFSGRANVHFFSLKKEVTPADAAVLAAAPNLTDLRPQLTDFADTAALIEQLDLVIAVDTSIAHLAGALGRPVWVLLPFSPDWRWFLDRDDSPWYPSARLFRQPNPGNWPAVISEVCSALETFSSAPN